MFRSKCNVYDKNACFKFLLNILTKCVVKSEDSFSNICCKQHFIIIWNVLCISYTICNATLRAALCFPLFYILRPQYIFLCCNQNLSKTRWDHSSWCSFVTFPQITCKLTKKFIIEICCNIRVCKERKNPEKFSSCLGIIFAGRILF